MENLWQYTQTHSRHLHPVMHLSATQACLLHFAHDRPIPQPWGCNALCEFVWNHISGHTFRCVYCRNRKVVQVIQFSKCLGRIAASERIKTRPDTDRCKRSRFCCILCRHLHCSWLERVQQAQETRRFFALDPNRRARNGSDPGYGCHCDFGGHILHNDGDFLSHVLCHNEYFEDEVRSKIRTVREDPAYLRYLVSHNM